jgi:hypothetical protein
MKLKLLAAAALLACTGTGFASTSASAQAVYLSGPYRCVQNCQVPLNGQAFVTQNGWNLNLVNELGQPAHGWIDYPGHIWIDWWHEGAMFSPDGSTIQFDSGSVWQRI